MGKAIETSREIRQWIYLVGAAASTIYLLVPQVNKRVNSWFNKLINKNKED